MKINPAAAPGSNVAAMMDAILKGAAPAAAPIAEPVAAPAAAAPQATVVNGLVSPPADVRSTPAEPPAADAGDGADLKGPDGIEPPDDARTQPKAKSAWTQKNHVIKELNQKLADAEAKRKALADELDQVRTKPMELEEIAALKTKLQDAEERVGRLDIAQTQAFRERYDMPIQTEHQQLVAFLQRAGKTPEDATKMATEALKAGANMTELQNVLADEPTIVQSSVAQSVNRILTAAEQRQAALQDWQSTRSALNESVTRESTATLLHSVVESTDKAVADLVSEGSWLLTESPTDQDWNRQRDEIIRAGRVVLKEARPTEIAKYVLEGIAAAKYRLWGESEAAKAEKMAAEMAKRNSVRPGVGGSNVEYQEPAAPRPAAINPTNWLDQNLKKPAGR
jgi:chromosome segregation ATPase